MAGVARKSPQQGVESQLDALSLDTPQVPVKQAQKKSKKPIVADSWEDEDVSESDSETTPEAPTPASEGVAAPPPTPASPQHDVQRERQQWSDSNHYDADGTSKRPEKTDAVARRMIAAGLGLKAPKQTEEQKAYQKSIREQERKRREQEKAEEQKRKEDAERAKAAIWDD
jgi:hypothetical protein